MSIFKDDYGDWRVPWQIIGAVLGFVVAGLLLTIVLALVCMPFVILECNDIAAQTGLATKWTFWHGCYVNWQGQWLTEEMFRAITVLP